MSIMEKALELVKPINLTGEPSREHNDAGRGARGPLIDMSSEALSRQGLLGGSQPDRRRLDEFRTIKRPLVDNAAASRKSTNSRAGFILVTSSLPAEGKSYTSLNLALSLAQEQYCGVTLVDADAPRRSLSRMLGAQEQAGTLDYLRDAAHPLENLLCPTTVANLTFLPAGTPTERATELFAGPRMRLLIDELLSISPRHFVVLDTAPVLLAAESQVLSRNAGQILFVVRAGSTPQDVVKDAISRLNSECPIGVVLNRWKPMALSERRYYGQYYGLYHSQE